MSKTQMRIHAYLVKDHHELGREGTMCNMVLTPSSWNCIDFVWGIEIKGTKICGLKWIGKAQLHVDAAWWLINVCLVTCSQSHPIN